MRRRGGRRSLACCLVFIAGAAVAATSRQAKVEDFHLRHATATYRFGACGPQAMDCSCLVQRLYRQAFGLNLPRTTLGQAAALTAARVGSIGTARELREPALCVGDLVYTYQGRSWAAGPRHVAVYAGEGKLLHAWRGDGGVGSSPLSWARQFPLHGVYRPLGCRDGGADRGLPVVRAAAYEPADDAAVRSVIRRFFDSWRTGRTAALERTLWPDALLLGHGAPRDLDGILAARRTMLRDVRRAAASYRVEALSFWGDLAIAEVRYDLELVYAHHRRQHDGVRETLIFSRRAGNWRISHQESLFGD